MPTLHTAITDAKADGTQLSPKSPIVRMKTLLWGQEKDGIPALLPVAPEVCDPEFARMTANLLVDTTASLEELYRGLVLALDATLTRVGK